MSGETKIKSMGAIPHTGGVGFRVWAPNAQRVSVIGSFNGWDGDRHFMQAEENGHWYTDVAEAHIGDQYRYLLTTAKGEFKRIDPYAREVTHSVGNAIVHDPSFDWEGNDFHLTARKEIVIYELHLGTFNDRENNNLPGKFASVSSRLRHLKKLGVNAIQIMPISQFAGKVIGAPTWPPNRASTTASFPQRAFHWSVQGAALFAMIERRSSRAMRRLSEVRRPGVRSQYAIGIP